MYVYMYTYIYIHTYMKIYMYISLECRVDKVCYMHILRRCVYIYIHNATLHLRIHTYDGLPSHIGR